MPKIHSSVVLLLIVVFSTCCLAANRTVFVNSDKTKLKVLAVFGHLAKSHFDVFKPLLEELARRGHELTVISFFPRTDSAKAKEPLPNYKDINLVDPKIGIFMNVIDLHKLKQTWFRPMQDFHRLKFFADRACNIGLRNAAVKEFLQSDEKFDVILTENFNTDCYLGFIHRFKAPYLAFSSHQIMPWTNNDMGNADDPSYIPVLFLGLTRPLNFFSRMQNALWQPLYKIVYEYWFRPDDQLIANEIFGPDLPKLKEIAQQSQALLVNTHSSIHGSRPQLPNVVEIGGIHIPPKINPLPRDIAKFLDDAHEGVLYFNFGSMIRMSTMPREKLDAILKTIGSIPRKAILKWETHELPYKLDNVMVKKWLPQFDVINHPNVKCYLGHGGLLGLSESVYVGLPMVLVPMFGDQFHNAAGVQTRGAAVVIEYNNLNEQSFRHALDQVFNDSSYRENAQRLSKAYRDRPATPLETAVWWTEYVARGNGRFYFRSEGADLPWYQSLLIDVVLVFIIVSAALIYIAFRLIKLLLSLLGVVKGTPGSQAGEKSKWKKRD
ncbi:PREDICTED: UDP-glucuronosyltransferase 2B20-like isoform X3 [Vollenhovia emeryi]|uniref:UDP-glucuronosyltransferase 2B20-like isoform X3 n=1 Tax=Vollenhovia emeryi TaxID=411798 RepID=UPI0005F3FF82|nr:PREDICTED: UDP-glucuronosyltransferase 2B20-like isoform X3 [Vollenhovia emeryi]